MNPRIALIGPFCAVASLSASAQTLQWTSHIELPGVSQTTCCGLPVEIATLEVHDDGTGAALFAGGRFLKAGGASVNLLARWDGNGWNAVFLGLSPSYVGALLTDDPELYVGGMTGGTSGGVVGFVSQVGSSTGLIGTFFSRDDDHEAEVRALALFDSGGGLGPELYAAGTFVGGSIRRREGTVWQPLGSGVLLGPTQLPNSMATVNALQVFDDGSGSALYVGGKFNTAGGISQHSVARWNGSAWSGFSGPVPDFGVCAALAVYDDGSGSGPALYAAGLNGLVMRMVGASWSQVAPSTGAIHALEVLDDGTGPALYAAGKFTSIGGTAAMGIARWDGVSWSALAGGLGVSGNASALALQRFDRGTALGASLYVGGSFDSANGAPVDKLAAWGPSDAVGSLYCFGDGSLATPCPCAPPDVVPSPSGAAGGGCANSFNWNGARLTAAGSLNPDHVRLGGTGITPVGFTVLIAGDGSDPAGIAAGDGVRCVAGSFVRFGAQSAVNGNIVYPNVAVGWTAPLSVVSGVAPGSGQKRYYQAFYRNAQPGFCNPATFNFTSAVELVW